MSATQVNLTERSENVVFSKKKGLHLESDSNFLYFPLKFVMTPQQGFSLLKSCVRRSFSFTRGNLQAFATHPHSLGDPWFEKHCFRAFDALR